MGSLNEQRLAKCSSTNYVVRGRTFMDCYVDEANRAAATGDTRAQYQMMYHNNLLMSFTYARYQEWMFSELAKLLPCLGQCPRSKKR